MNIKIEVIFVPMPMDIEIRGDVIELRRDQWNGNVAYISNYPGLLDEVKKYTWTYSANPHPYLNCSVLQISLHKFVLQFLYGKDKLDEMIGQSNIIEHLDNNGLNCAYENLHVLSEDMNKAKAFSIDKKGAALQAGEITPIPALVTDVYYSHKNRYFQMQVFFNKDIARNPITNNYAEGFVFHYDDFDSLYIDWLYCYDCISKESFDVNKHHAVRVYAKDVSQIVLREDENDAVIVERDGEHYLVIRTDPEKGLISFVNHISYKEIEDVEE